MTANIFISFASKDVKMAMTLCTALENRGYKCWISARDIQPGENFQVAIVQAIRHAKIMLLVFTGNSNNSEEMTKELALASQQKMIVIPLRVEDVTPSDAFAYEFATRQWIDFFADWEFAIEQLARRIANALRERNAGLETNDATEALTSVAAVAPVAYAIEPPKPESKALTPEPARPAEPAAKAPDPAPASAASKASKSVAESSAVEVREEVLAALRPQGTQAPAAKAAPVKPEPAKTPAPPPPAKPAVAAAPDASPDKPAAPNRKVLVIAGVVILALIGVGLLAPTLMRSRPASGPEAATTPVQQPTVITAPAAPAPEVSAPVAATPVATNAIAPAAAVNSAATNAPAEAPKPKKKAPKGPAPKTDDIPF